MKKTFIMMLAMLALTKRLLSVRLAPLLKSTLYAMRSTLPRMSRTT